MLHRMIIPNAEARCTASDAMTDSYWMEEINADGMSVNESLMTMSSPAPGKAYTPVRVRKADAKLMSPVDKENMRPLAEVKSNIPDGTFINDVHIDVTSVHQALLDKTRFATRPPRRVYPYALSPIEGSPRSARTAAGRENIPPSPLRSPRVAVARARPPVKRKPVPVFSENMSPRRMRGKITPTHSPKKDAEVRAWRNSVLADTTSRVHNIETPLKAVRGGYGKEEKGKGKPAETPRQFGSGSYDRVKAFERLKQLERNRFLEEEEDEEEDEENRERPPDKKASGGPEQEEIREQEPDHPPKASSRCMTSTSLGALSAITKVDDRSTPARSFGRPKTATSSFTLITDFRNTFVDQQVLEETVAAEGEFYSLPQFLMQFLMQFFRRHETGFVGFIASPWSRAQSRFVQIRLQGIDWYANTLFATSE